MKLSIIVPCKNEEGNIIEIYNKINEVLKKIKYEILFIDDGSTDKTMEKLREVYSKDMLHVKVLSFSRNFKKEAAMYAGLKYATGEYTCIIDGDLQQNPSYLIEMLQFLDDNKEYDEVAMVVRDRKTESKFMKFCKKIFYKLIDTLSDVHFENAASDFRMFRTNVKEAILSLSEKVRFSKGIFSWVGFSVKYLPYTVEERASGVSKFNFKASLAYAIDGILSFSTKPLKLSLGLGLLTLFGSFVYFIIVLIQACMNNYFSGIHVIVLLFLLLFGFQFILMGIIGEYLAKTYTEIKDRPLYIIKEKLGFSDETIL